MQRFDSLRKLFYGAAVSVVAVFLLLAPAHAWAQNIYDPLNTFSPGLGTVLGNPPGDCDNTSTTAATNGSVIAYAKAVGNRLYPLGYGPLKTSAAACLSTLQTLFNTISSLLSTPFDPTGVVTGILSAVEAAVVAAIGAAICSALNGVLNFAKSALSLLTLLCIAQPPYQSTSNIYGATIPPGTDCSGSPFSSLLSFTNLSTVLPTSSPYKFQQ